MVNPQRHLRTNLHGQPREVVERVGDPAVGRVLQWHHAVVGMAGLHLFECGRDTGHRHEVDGAAEAVQCRQMAVGPGGAEVSYAEVLLDGTRPGDELAEDGLHALVGERAHVGRGGPLEHGFFAGRIVGLLAVRLLDVADLAGDLGAVVHQPDELSVDLVDLGSQLRETRLFGAVARRIPR